MMFSGWKTPVIFKWNSRGKSSSNTEPLVDARPEIELSEYQRLASSGSESPSGFLNGEGLTTDAIADLDIFFERVYNYYCEKGLWCIIVKWIVELLSLSFTISFSCFFLLFVDWNGLRNAKCGIDAVKAGNKPCDLAKEAIHSHPLVPFTFSKAIIVGYLAIFTIYLLFCFLRFFAQLKDTLEMRHFYNNSLNITDREVQTTPWPIILEKVVAIQHSQQLCVVKDLSCHEIVMRIMRKQNYLIGMLNKGLLAFPISSWIPGAGPAVSSQSCRRNDHLVLTKTFEWILYWCILQSMFDRNYCIRRDFLSNPSSLRKRLVTVGIVMLLLSPFLVIFMLVYFFLRHAEQFYNHPSTASSRRWSNLSWWIFREFNEVDHLFKHRINNGVMHASDYLKQFPSHIISLIAKFISFVSGGFAAILIIIAFLEESLLEGHIFGRNLLWYAAIFGTVTAISRAAVTDDLPVRNPEEAMSLVVQHTHYMPKRWRGKENTDSVRLEFETLFQYTGMMLLEEITSIFLTPYLLLCVVPKRVNDILQFISDFTVDVEGVGHVCSFSTFDFEIHGNSKYGSPLNASRDKRSSQGKMEKSFLSFQNVYLSWEPNSQGEQFVFNLRNFQRRAAQEIQRAYSPGQLWKPSQSLGQTELINRLHSRDVPCLTGITRPWYNMGSIGSTNPEQRARPYLLDWYYIAQPPCQADNPRIVLQSESHVMEIGGLRPLNNSSGSNKEMEGNWSSPPVDRLQSHIEAASSRPYTHDSIFRNYDSAKPEDPTEGRWWARTGPRSPNPESSFLEPPSFHRPSFVRGGDFSNEILEEEEEDDAAGAGLRTSHMIAGPSLGKSQVLSRTTYLDGYEDDEAFSLPFNDIYTTPTGNLPFTSEPTKDAMS